MTVAQAHARASFLQAEAEAEMQRVYGELADALKRVRSPRKRDLAKQDAEAAVNVVRKTLRENLAVVTKELLDAPGRPGRKIEREYPWHTERQERTRQEHETLSLGDLANGLHLGVTWTRTARGARRPNRMLSLGA